jgi:peptidoglycan/LPS O-acetylase OafA/YrhL
VIATTVTAVRNVAGIVVMVVGWGLVIGGEAAVLGGFALIVLLVVGDVPLSVSPLDPILQGLVWAVGGVLLAYVVGPRIGGPRLRPRWPRRESRTPA